MDIFRWFRVGRVLLITFCRLNFCFISGENDGTCGATRAGKPATMSVLAGSTIGCRKASTCWRNPVGLLSRRYLFIHHVSDFTGTARTFAGAGLKNVELSGRMVNSMSPYRGVSLTTPEFRIVRRTFRHTLLTLRWLGRANARHHVFTSVQTELPQRSGFLR